MKQRDVTIVLGQTGSGKSFTANQILKAYPRVLVAGAGFGDFEVSEFQSYSELVDHLETNDCFGTFRPFRVGYDFRPEEYNLAFETALAAKNCLLVLEEADRFPLRELPGYQEVIYRGRHYEINLLAVSLAPKDLPTDLRRQSTRIISFRQIMPDDLDWLAEIVGEEAYQLPQLSGPPQKPPHPYLEWTQLGGVKIVSPKRDGPLTA